MTEDDLLAHVAKFPLGLTRAAMLEWGLAYGVTFDVAEWLASLLRDGRVAAAYDDGGAPRRFYAATDVQTFSHTSAHASEHTSGKASGATGARPTVHMLDASGAPRGAARAVIAFLGPPEAVARAVESYARALDTPARGPVS